MLDDDFAEIEGFLKAEGNSELQTVQKFDKILNDFMIKKFKDVKESFATLNTVIYQSYSGFEKNAEEVIKDFGLTVIVIKKLISMLQDENNHLLNDEDKQAYLILMKSIVDSLKDETKSYLNFFTIFSEYIDDTDKLIGIKD